MKIRCIVQDFPKPYENDQLSICEVETKDRLVKNTLGMRVVDHVMSTCC